MEYLLDGRQMKAVDTYSIEKVGIPSLVLMERAALKVTCSILDALNVGKDLIQINKKVLCVCGKGNNGADALAVARQLNEKKIDVTVMVVSGSDKPGTKEFEIQFNAVNNLGIKCIEFNNQDETFFREYKIIVDGIFGIGLSRDIEGVYADVIEAVNAAGYNGKCTNHATKIVSVDIPSGINASDSHIMKHAIKADMTVTFGYNKVGMALYPGKEYAGRVITADIGFAPDAVERIDNKVITFTDDDIKLLPIRDKDSNKGTYGKVLIIAGSENMGGAACMSALAAYRSGAGLVKVITHENNRGTVLNHVPEAILVTYNKETDIKSCIQSEVKWATCVAAGPGISQSDSAEAIVASVLESVKNKPLILDADALNIISKKETLQKLLMERSHDGKVVITPHLGEMSRLCKESIPGIKNNLPKFAALIAEKYNVCCVLKDAATVVCDGKDTYINSAGNPGMATAGSGDVLAGILAGLLSIFDDKDTFTAVCLCVYLHARAGDKAANKYGQYGMKAMDIADSLPYVIKENISKIVFENKI